MSTVLVVDDEERIRTLITRTLTAEGHSVDTAGDGDGALARMAAQGVDLVLLDLVMPRCHGLTVLSSLRQREDPTPVIVLSGVTDIAARVQALDRGAVDVVAKPFSLAELLARTRRHLAATRAPRADGQGENRLPLLRRAQVRHSGEDRPARPHRFDREASRDGCRARQAHWESDG